MIQKIPQLEDILPLLVLNSTLDETVDNLHDYLSKEAIVDLEELLPEETGSPMKHLPEVKERDDHLPVAIAAAG